MQILPPLQKVYSKIMNSTIRSGASPCLHSNTSNPPLTRSRFSHSYNCLRKNALCRSPFTISPGITQNLFLKRQFSGNVQQTDLPNAHNHYSERASVPDSQPPWAQRKFSEKKKSRNIQNIEQFSLVFPQNVRRNQYGSDMGAQRKFSNFVYVADLGIVSILYSSRLVIYVHTTSSLSKFAQQFFI